MEKTALIRIYLFLFTGFFLLSGYSHSQDQKLTKEERKEAKKMEEAQNFLDIGALLDGRKFVLRLEHDLSSSSMQINSQYNFLQVDSVTCKFYTEHKYYVLLRQVTDSPIIGKLEKWELTKDTKRLNYTLKFRMNTWFGLFRVYMTIEPDRTATGDITVENNHFEFRGYVSTL